ncbi:MAG: N-acetyl-gamma-glutamyl-phosphate reductase [Eubacteriales bacterium]|nr:N-acetyl-gamma-glutamyl-phosphate reductase [Eubacteriales bacterium]
MKKIGIIGASGYAGAELCRLLLRHPDVEIAAVSSKSFVGESIEDLYPVFQQVFERTFETEAAVIEASDVIFAALPHGLSQELAYDVIRQGKIFIDLGADFRLEDETEYQAWYGLPFTHKDLHFHAVYGLPELFREQIRETTLVANPGCYTTCVQLALAPAVAAGLIDTSHIIADCKSGATGAGRTLSKITQFMELNEGMHAYKVANHRHTPEIEQTLRAFTKEDVHVTFVPHLLPVNRGILATCYAPLKKKMTAAAIRAMYAERYGDEYFVRVLGEQHTPNIGNVRYSNFCDISIYMDERTGTLITVSALDNMLKGAAGQAIQNMNILLGLPERTGLDMIPPAF